jgi:aspartyl-tRNA(Asn)/glutamyl-tRNA(Gln) amidotransferase subunit A
MVDLSKLTIKETHEHLIDGDFSAVELAKAYISEIEKNKELNAYLEVYSDVEAQAKEADKRIASGERQVLTGIPIALKDNILVEGKKVSAGSKILEGFTAPYDATVVEKLKNSGVVFLGRTNMDEFAMGTSTENSAFGTTKNPHDKTRVPGGSSGGSAVAVAANLALAALGSDTGGSIRQPAALCGCVGLKPTYGSVSRYGLIALGSSLDQIGPLAKTVGDAKLVFDCIKGKDSKDSTSSYEEDEKMPKEGALTIGIPWHLLEIGGVHPDVKRNFSDSIEKLRDLGFEIKDIKLPNAHLSLAAYYIILPAEISSNLARYDGMKYGLSIEGGNLLEDYLLTRRGGFGPEPLRRILLGTYVLSSGYYDAYYSKANNVRSLVRGDYENAFREVDVIVMPTSPTPAFKIGEKVSDPLEMYLADVFTVSANIADIPALAVPSGFSENDGVKLPLGIQFIGPYFSENLLFKTGKKFLGE